MKRNADLVKAEIPASLRGYDSLAHSSLTATDVGGPSLVQQQFKDEVDVNTIMRRFGISQSLPLGPDSGVFGDFTDIDSFEDAVMKVGGANEKFMKLPPEIRERFFNDPGRLIKAAQEMPEAELASMLGMVPVVDPVPVVP